MSINDIVKNKRLLMHENYLHAYMQETLRCAKALNLTSVHNANDFKQRMIMPSLAMLDLLPESGRLLDVGSGMGVPAIPIMIARPALYGILVERRRKRCEFLRHMRRHLVKKIGVVINYDVIAEDIRHIAPLQADICVARAVTESYFLLKMITPHILGGGCAVFIEPVESIATEQEGWQCDAESLYVCDTFRQRLRRYRRNIINGVSRET
ncbi:MAG: RsmG family class I SAM-dependent methyltransferase [Mariprofundales bacterium]